MKLFLRMLPRVTNLQVYFVVKSFSVDFILSHREHVFTKAMFSINRTGNR